MAFAPVRGDDVISPEEFEKLPEKEREAVQAEIATLQGELQKVLRQIPCWQREQRDKVRELNQEVIHFAVGLSFEELRRGYADLAEVVAHLEAVERDVENNAGELMSRQGGDGGGEGGSGGGPRSRGGRPGGGLDGDPSLRRFSVNVLIDHAQSEAAPVVYEDNPTYANLVGRVEHLSQMGALVTDFTLIKAGALHRANGGYLMLDADRLLRQPFAYEALKRALTGGAVKIESLGQVLSLVATVSLEPEPVPLQVKIVLIGEPLYYYLLSPYDPEFDCLFKVAADFD